MASALIFGFIALVLTAFIDLPGKVTFTEMPEMDALVHGFAHGFLIAGTLIISIFDPSITIYQAVGHTIFYNFGFVIGTMMFYQIMPSTD